MERRLLVWLLVGPAICWMELEVAAHNHDHSKDVDKPPDWQTRMDAWPICLNFSIKGKEIRASWQKKYELLRAARDKVKEVFDKRRLWLQTRDELAKMEIAKQDKKWEEEKEARRIERKRWKAQIAFAVLDEDRDRRLKAEELVGRNHLDTDGDAHLTFPEALDLLGGNHKTDFNGFYSHAWPKIGRRFVPPADALLEQLNLEKTYGFTRPRPILTDDSKPDYTDWTYVRLEEAEDARRSFEEVERDFNEILNQTNEMKTRVLLQMGKEQQFIELYQKCFTIEDEEFEYSVCPFVNVTQKMKKEPNSSPVLIGNYHGWEMCKFHTEYRGMRFKRGTPCYLPGQMGAIPRQAMVHYKCAVDIALTFVEETTPCEYDFRLTHPCACIPPKEALKRPKPPPLINPPPPPQFIKDEL